jgi:hypothetical protein
MADAYGMLVFSKSKDCKFDSKKLQNVLNEYRWNMNGTEWIYNSKRKLFFIDAFSVQYPTVFLDYEAAYEIKKKNGKIKTVKADEMTAEDFDNIWDAQLEIVSLKKLSEVVSSTLKSGWIEISCCGNEKNSYVYYESLRVYASGKALRQGSKNGPAIDSVDFFEEV